MTLKHNKVSGKANPSDTTVIGGGHWDEDHLFKSSSAGKLLAVGSSDAVVDIGPQDACYVWRSASVQAIADSTETTVDFLSSATVEYDSNTMFSTSATTRITIKTAGIYIVTANITWTGDPDGRRDVSVYKNASDYLMRNIMPSGGTSTALCQTPFTIAELAVNDYITMTVRHTAGSSIDLTNAGRAPGLGVAWLRPVA